MLLKQFNIEIII